MKTESLISRIERQYFSYPKREGKKRIDVWLMSERTAAVLDATFDMMLGKLTRRGVRYPTVKDGLMNTPVEVYESRDTLEIRQKELNSQGKIAAIVPELEYVDMSNGTVKIPTTT